MTGNHNSGRPRTRDDNDPFVQLDREMALQEYYENKEYKLQYAKEYHKRIKDFADLWGISFKEAQALGVGRYGRKQIQVRL